MMMNEDDFLDEWINEIPYLPDAESGDPFDFRGLKFDPFDFRGLKVRDN